MTALTRPAVVWSLLACLVFVNGAMVKPSVAHAAKHANHHAGTHSTGLCAWLCAAGQGIETSSVVLECIGQPVEQVVAPCINQHERPLFSAIFLRGPPASS